GISGRRACGAHRIGHGRVSAGDRVIDDSAASAAGPPVTSRGDGRRHLAELLRVRVSRPTRCRYDRAHAAAGENRRGRRLLPRNGARMTQAAAVVTGSRAFVRDLVALTKPRIISLLLVTTIAPMFVAGNPSWTLVLAVFAGGYLMAGGANAVNMYMDRDI